MHLNSRDSFLLLWPQLLPQARKLTVEHDSLECSARAHHKTYRQATLSRMGKVEEGAFRGPGLGITISVRDSFRVLLSYDLWTPKLMVLNSIRSNTLFL